MRWSGKSVFEVAHPHWGVGIGFFKQYGKHHILCLRCAASILDGLRRTEEMQQHGRLSQLPLVTTPAVLPWQPARSTDFIVSLLPFPQELTNLRQRRYILIASSPFTIPIAICAYFIQNSSSSSLYISLHLIIDNIHSSSLVLNSREKWQLPPCWAGVLCRRWLGFPPWGLRRRRLTSVAHSLQDWRSRVHSFTRSRDGEAWLCLPSKIQTPLL